ncbi:nucleoside recognition domain-containing protein, partial [Saccharophagus degradans]
ESPDLLGDTLSDFAAVWNYLTVLAGALTDPLVISSAQEEIASEQTGSYQAMKNLITSASGAYCYLVFILMYEPCVATIGVM